MDDKLFSIPEIKMMSLGGTNPISTSTPTGNESGQDTGVPTESGEGTL